MRTQRRSKRHPAYEHKVKAGLERNAAWAMLTNAAKLQSLDTRLGPGLGAACQRKKLSVVPS